MTVSSLSRRLFMQGLGAAAAAPLPRVWAQPQEASLSFLAVGDWGRDGAFHQQEVADRMGETARLLQSRFVVSVGDNFYENGVDSVVDPKWRTSFEDIYRAPSLRIPWYSALGNHDYHGNPQAQVDYARSGSRWRMPGRWYSFTQGLPAGGRVEFFVLDTSPMIDFYHADGGRKVKVADQDAAAQLRWLQNALAASTADWKIVVGHHPIHSGSAHGGWQDLQLKLDPWLQRYQVPLYLNGHDHDLRHEMRGHTHYVCTGAGSKMEPQCSAPEGDFCSVRSGFVVVSLTRTRLALGYRDYTGAVLDVVDIPHPGSFAAA